MDLLSADVAREAAWRVGPARRRALVAKLRARRWAVARRLPAGVQQPPHRRRRKRIRRHTRRGWTGREARPQGAPRAPRPAETTQHLARWWDLLLLATIASSSPHSPPPGPDGAADPGPSGPTEGDGEDRNQPHREDAPEVAQREPSFTPAPPANRPPPSRSTTAPSKVEGTAKTGRRWHSTQGTKDGSSGRWRVARPDALGHPPSTPTPWPW